jgi:hypothetical protein
MIVLQLKEILVHASMNQNFMSVVLVLTSKTFMIDYH